MKKLILITGIVSFIFIGKLSAQDVALAVKKDMHTTDGIELYDIHKYKESIVEFNKAIKDNPKDGKAFYYRGMAKMHDKQNGFCKDLEESLKLGYSTSADIYYYGCDTHVKK
jgi:hypothetical protein